MNKYQILNIKPEIILPEFKINCECCNMSGIFYQSVQNTRYENSNNNVVFLCKECKQINDEYWQERWREYHSGLL
jgi:hypothetical protein